MIRLTQLSLPLGHAPEALVDLVRSRLRLPPTASPVLQIARRGHDARQRGRVRLVYTVDVEGIDEAAALRLGDPGIGPTPDRTYRPPAILPATAPRPSRPIVVGTGPCGLMAGLVLAEAGFAPLLLERGPIVRTRTRETWGLWRRSVLNPEANVQYGEGGAGTFSDGKLYSQVTDRRHLGRKVLETFVECGAPEEILWAAKPHIGTFRLVTVVEGIRARIEALGGTYRFDTKVVDLRIETAADGARRVTGLVLHGGEELDASHVVLALGHSARDTVTMLHDRSVAMEAKPLSIGVRIEHPQSLIDQARFGPQAGDPVLGAADYKLVHHAGNGRSVYSFCMCPGGTVVAAASEAGHLVTNGMSQYSRAERNANAGLVVGVTPADFEATRPPSMPPGHPLAGIAFQRHWERLAFEVGGGTYAAPAQRVGDFLAGRPSTSLGTVIPSYRPGVTPTDLARCLPDYAVAAMREALPRFDHQLHGYALADAVMTGVETRTSSPVRIPRTASCVSLNTQGLYPAGEGAGYAGGILSAGIDGIRVAEEVALSILGRDRPAGERRFGQPTELVYG